MDDNLDFLGDYFNNSSYVWVPVVAFVLIVLFAGIIGFINGWKTSLYFMGWNIVGVISGVLLTSPIIDSIDSIDIMKALISSIKEIVGVLILFLYMLIINFLAFLFYWIFRGKLKKSMTDNKNVGTSNLSSRFIGLGIAVASSVPTAVYLSDSVAIMSNENGFTKFLDNLTKAFTGGKYKGSAEARTLTGNANHVVNFFKAIVGEGDITNIDPNSPGTKAALKEVLETDLSKNIDTIYNGIADSGIAGDDFSRDMVNDVEASDIVDKMPILKLDLDKDKVAQLKASLDKLFKNNNNPGVVDTILKRLVA